MTLTLKYTFLAVDDHEKALAFYRDVLGFEVHNDVGNGDMRWITLGLASQPGIELVLEPPGVEASQKDRETIKALMAKGVFGWLVFDTDDVDATFDAVRISGADVVQEPMDQPHGVRDCAFRDPAGNQVRFSQSKVA